MCIRDRLSDDEVAVFDVATMSDDSPVGYFIECDLHYPAHLHDLHNAYPLAPEHVKIEESMGTECSKRPI